MADSVANFAFSTVATAPSPATTGTSLVVASGEGTLFPAVPFNAVVYPSDADPSTSNAEIVRVTAVSTDTLTITREQESTSARTIVTGDRIHAGVTKELMEQFTAKSLFDAHSILAANSDNTPSALTVAASRIVARGASGNIDAKTLSEVLDFVGSASDGDILMRSSGSWTRLAKGTDGQVLTLASGLPSWAAAGGGGGGGGLETILDEVTLSSHTSVTLEGIDSTSYDFFRVYLSRVVPDGDRDIRLQFTAAGTPTTSGYKMNTRYYASTSSGGTQGSGAAQAYISYYSVESDAAAGGFNGIVDIPRVSDSLWPVFRAHGQHYNSGNNLFRQETVGGLVATVAGVDGVKIYPNTGNFASGKMILTGVKVTA